MTESVAKQVWITQSVGHNDAQNILDWAKKFCPSYVTNAGIRHNDGWYYVFYFGNEAEASLFRLKFGEFVKSTSPNF